ncbi:hypothetical protein [Mycoplasma capricolum]|uniref:hypothetical protein n=1 Tax=Mycoplasma capricolum TaxID=2095 RepID=UPI003DA40C54
MKKTRTNQNFDSKVFFISKISNFKNNLIAIIIFIFLFISMFRLTLIGQFFDDVFFSFLFGWFKYLIYFLLFVFNFCLFKKLVVAIKLKAFIIIGFFTIVLASFLTLNFIIWQFINEQTISNNYKIYALWQNDILVQIIKFYNYHWYTNSVFTIDFKNWINYFFNKDTYFNLFLFGGFISYFICGIFWYFTLPASYLTLIVLLIISLVWLVTDDPFYLLKNKTKKISFKNNNTSDNQIDTPKVVKHYNVTGLEIFKNKLDDNLELPIYKNKEKNLLTNLENILLDTNFVDKMLFLKLEKTDFKKEQEIINDSTKDPTNQFKNHHKEGILTDSQISPFKRNKPAKKISDDEFFNELFEQK